VVLESHIITVDL